MNSALKRGALLLALVVLSGLASSLLAQDTSQFVVRENFKREIVIGDKRYRVYNNWVTFGMGYAYHNKNPRTQLALGMNYHFHIRKYYFTIGGMLSGDAFGVWNNYNLHVGYVPWRKETEKHNIATTICFSYSTGYAFRYAGVYETKPYNAVGVYGEFQYTRKAQYAVGAGPTFFVEANSRLVLLGLRIDGYLSGAYRGYVKGKAPVKNY